MIPKKQKLRVLVFSLAGLITLIMLGYALAHYIGKQKWLKVKGELEAKGEILSLAKLKPAPVPDAENFYAIPLFAEVLSNPESALPPDSQAAKFKPLIDALQKLQAGPELLTAKRADWSKFGGLQAAQERIAELEPFLEPVRTARHRRFANGNLQWDKGISMPLPHLTVLLSVSRALLLHGAAAIAQGNPDAAMADVEALLRTAQAGFQEPLLMTNLVGISAGANAFSLIWEGLEAKAWSDGHLKAIERLLAGFPSPGQSVAQAFRSERGTFNDLLLQMIDKRSEIATLMQTAAGVSGAGTQTPLTNMIGAYLYPAGLLYSDLAHYNETLQSLLEALQQEPVLLPVIRETKPWTHPFTSLILPSLTPILERTASFTAYLRLTRTTVAIERYRLKHGELPEKLERLAPDFLAEALLDPMTGKEFVYDRSGPASFALWSVGWDRTDDRGAPYDREKRTGDWVWRSP